MEGSHCTHDSWLSTNGIHYGGAHHLHMSFPDCTSPTMMQRYVHHYDVQLRVEHVGHPLVFCVGDWLKVSPISLVGGPRPTWWCQGEA
jgi:hypothetical protein